MHAWIKKKLLLVVQHSFWVLSWLQYANDIFNKWLYVQICYYDYSEKDGYHVMPSFSTILDMKSQI